MPCLYVIVSSCLGGSSISQPYSSRLCFMSGTGGSRQKAPKKEMLWE